MAKRNITELFASSAEGTTGTAPDKFMSPARVQEKFTGSDTKVAAMKATSTTSLAIGTGSKVFTTQAGKSFFVGTPVRAASDSGPSALNMNGVVTAYSGTSLTVEVQSVTGSGTLADWTITVNGYVHNINSPVATDPNIFALNKYEDAMDDLKDLGILDQPAAYFDFINNVYFVKNTLITNNIAEVLSSVGGVMTRTSTATYFDSNGIIQVAPAATLRTDYDPVTKLSRGALMEGTRINLFVRSEELDTTWTKTGTTITSNVSVSPSGTMTVDKIVPSTVSEGHYISQAVSFTTGTPYCLSIFAKASGYRYLRLSLPSGPFTGSARCATFDLETGTITGTEAGASSRITSIGNGFYRCEVSATSITTSAGAPAFSINQSGTTALEAHIGDGTSGIECWGAQIETGPTSSSYIPTVGSGAQRNNEQLSIILPPAVLNQSEGTLVLECDITSTSSSSYLDFQLTDASVSADRILNRMTGNRVSHFYSFNNTTGVAGVNPMQLANGLPSLVRAVTGFKSGDYAGSVNNSNPTTSAATTIPNPLLTRLQFFIGTYTTVFIRRAIYYPAKLSNANIKILSNLNSAY